MPCWFRLGRLGGGDEGGADPLVEVVGAAAQGVQSDRRRPSRSRGGEEEEAARGSPRHFFVVWLRALAVLCAAMYAAKRACTTLSLAFIYAAVIANAPELQQEMLVSL